MPSIMNRRIVLYALLLISGGFVLCSCQRTFRQLTPEMAADGKYDSTYPSVEVSDYLQRITEMVYGMNAVGYYSGYVFPREARVTSGDIRSETVMDKASSEIVYNTSVLGSATVIHYSQNRIALLTCAHVLDFPDTSVTYFTREGSSVRSQYIQSVGIKIRQNNYIPEFMGVLNQNLEILAIDRQRDLAIVGGEFRQSPNRQVRVFTYPVGNARDLQWGSYVFLIGFPRGRKMVTRGIVSQPNRDRAHSFLTDALFNRGMSGSIVLAIRDGVPNFELVGMANSAAGEIRYSLTPEETYETTNYDPKLPYTGDIYVDLQQKINYGITNIISAEAIQAFLQKNESRLLEQGYDLNSRFDE
ncbi:MAG TPA: serine protease [bacterium]|nr:serine protease [bacterium]